MQNNYSAEQLHLAARLYYVDGLGQAEVAKLVKVSQAKVSRLLASARERGIVRITVADYESQDRALEQALCERAGLQKAFVVKTLPDADTDDARLAIGHFGAGLIASLLSREDCVAIAGGRTMRDLVTKLPENRGLGVSVVQAMGSIDSTPGAVDAVELGRTLAERFGGTFSALNTPAFVPTKRVRDAFVSLSQVKSVFERLDRADVALVGIGTLEQSVFVERGVLSTRDLAKLQSAGAVGEICGRYFDQAGRECDSPWGDRVISMHLEQLRKTPMVVGIVAAGSHRTAAISAAIRGGLLKALLTDSATATALLHEFKPARLAKAR